MLNEEKVILMTKLASYETHEGKRCQKVANYFRGDYIVIQLAKSLVAATISFGIIFGLYMIYDLEEFMENIYKMDLISFARNILTYYIYFVVVFLAITYVYSAWCYYKAKKSLRNYYQNLKKLSSFYKDKN